MFVPQLRSCDRRFCAHELCPRGTLCHHTEEFSTILPLASLQVAILTNSDQGQTLASTQRTGEEVAAMWLHYLRQEQKCSLYSDRTGHIPFPWCSWDTSPATFTWLETANEGLSSVP